MRWPSPPKAWRRCAPASDIHADVVEKPQPLLNLAQDPFGNQRFDP
jgi:hypothetical protein